MRSRHFQIQEQHAGQRMPLAVGKIADALQVRHQLFAVANNLYRVFYMCCPVGTALFGIQQGPIQAELGGDLAEVFEIHRLYNISRCAEFHGRPAMVILA